MLLTIEELKAKQIKILEENVELVEKLAQEIFNEINEIIETMFVVNNEDSFTYYINKNNFKVCGSEIVFEAFVLRIIKALKDNGFIIELSKVFDISNTNLGYNITVKNPVFVSAESIFKKDSLNKTDS